MSTKSNSASVAIKKRVKRLAAGFKNLTSGTDFDTRDVLTNNFEPYLYAIENRLLAASRYEYREEPHWKVEDFVEKKVSQLIEDFGALSGNILMDCFKPYLDAIEENLSAAKDAKEKAENAVDDFNMSILASDDMHQACIDYA